MRYASDEDSRRRYTAFLSRHERCNFQQSVQWAQVKSNWKNEIILAEDSQGNITGGLSVLIRRIPPFGNIMYSPRGPVCDPHDAESLRQLTEGAELLAWKYNAMALRMEPDIPADDDGFRALAESLGYRIRDRIRSSRDVIQPRCVFRLDLAGRTEEQLLAGFKPKLRYNIRLAQRRGVVVREGTREDLRIFHELMVQTGRRDRFLTRPLAYFQRIWDAFGPEHVTLLLAWYEGEPLAGVIPIHYGDKTWYAFGASADRHRELMPNHLLQWETIRRALARGDRVYDLRGVLECLEPSNGLYLFKSRFGAELTKFVGEVTMPYKPMVYRAYRLAERAFMTARDWYTTLRGRRERPASDTPAAAPVPLLLPPAVDTHGTGHKTA